MSKNYNFSVFMGRFQPFHKSHHSVVKHGLEIADKLIILIGSHNKAIDWKNPFTSEQRIQMIKDSLSAEELANIYFQTIEDNPYDDNAWVESVNVGIDAVLHEYSKFRLSTVTDDGMLNTNRPKICIVGCDRDDTTFYLKLFPHFDQAFVDHNYVEGTNQYVSATMVRTALYNDKFHEMKHLLPEGSYNYVKNWMASKEHDYVKQWYFNDVAYQKPYESLPYGTNFYCADNVIFWFPDYVQDGYVLLVQRKKFPGQGLWAVPGGHINKNETSYTAALRELKEETTFDITQYNKLHDRGDGVIIGNSYLGEKVFDHPARSLRGTVGGSFGRTVSISHGHSLVGHEMPAVQANDDAADVKWVALKDIKKMKNQLFEDHFWQIMYFLDVIGYDFEHFEECEPVDLNVIGYDFEQYNYFDLEAPIEFSTRFYPKLSSSNIKLYVCDDNGQVDYSKRLYVSQKLAEKLIKLIESEQDEEKL